MIQQSLRKSPTRRDVSFKDKNEENLNGCWKKKEKKILILWSTIFISQVFY